MSKGVTAHGAKALIASASGTRIALFTNDPLATAHTTGISRTALTPVTCCAFNARSSPSTPAVFFAATLLRIATSSRTVAMSSRRASKLEAAMAAFSRTPYGDEGTAAQPYPRSTGQKLSFRYRPPGTLMRRRLKVGGVTKTGLRPHRVGWQRQSLQCPSNPPLRGGAREACRAPSRRAHRIARAWTDRLAKPGGV